MLLTHSGHTVAGGAIEVNEPGFGDHDIALDLCRAESAVLDPAVNGIDIVSGDVGDLWHG